MGKLKNLTKIITEKGGEKMKKLIICLLAVGIVGLVSVSQVMATPGPSQTLAVTATVANLAPELDITILKFTDGNPDNDLKTNTIDVTSTMLLDFGTLVHTYTVPNPGNPNSGITQDAGIWFSNAAYAVFVYATGYGKKYEVTSTCLGLQGAGGTLPANAFVVTPFYAPEDRFVFPGSPDIGQGPIPGTLGTAGSAVATGKSIYLSEQAGSPRVIQTYYAIPPALDAHNKPPYPGWDSKVDAIQMSQAPGTYTGTVKISIVAK